MRITKEQEDKEKRAQKQEMDEKQERHQKGSAQKWEE